MSKNEVKVYMISTINWERTEGWTWKFTDLDEAHEKFWSLPSNWESHFVPQVYTEFVDTHDCGDDNE